MPGTIPMPIITYSHMGATPPAWFFVVLFGLLTLISGTVSFFCIMDGFEWGEWGMFTLGIAVAIVTLMVGLLTVAAAFS